MVSSRLVLGISYSLLALSFGAVFIASAPGGERFFHWLLWVHIAIIALGFWGELRRRKLARVMKGGLLPFIRSIPLWLALLAGPVGYIALETHRSAFQVTERSGAGLGSTRWFERDGRYFVQDNGSAAREIAADEYNQNQRRGFTFFAGAWVLFSYIVTLFWRYITVEERRLRVGGAS